MIDVKWIVEHPTEFDTSMYRRGSPVRSSVIIDIYEKDKKRKAIIQNIREQKNQLTAEIQRRKKNKESTYVLNYKISDLKEALSNLDENQFAKELNEILLSVPNILSSDVPYGGSENDNVVLSTYNSAIHEDWQKQHYEILPDLMDFETAVKLSGSRFTILRGDLSRLERAIGQFMLDTHEQYGYEELNVPTLVNENILVGTGQLPKFKEDLYHTQDKWLIPTAEVPLTNTVRDKILNFNEIEEPIRLTALTTCFRSEAGAAGKDVRGMIRQHQFNKVELVSIVRKEQCNDEFWRTINCAERILQLLKLPYRLVQLCSGDTGFSSKKTIDLEVWLPGANCYREISSISYCGDFQARRMNARFRNKDSKVEFVHTINGSGLAVGRTLVAILENYQNQDGNVIVPDVLQNYMHKKIITNSRK